MLVLVGGPVYAGTREGKLHLPAPLFLEESTNDLGPSSTCSEINKLCPLPYVPGTLQTIASMLYLHKLFFVLSL